VFVILEYTHDSTNTFSPTTFQFNNKKRTSVSPEKYRNEKGLNQPRQRHLTTPGKVWRVR